MTTLRRRRLVLGIAVLAVPAALAGQDPALRLSEVLPAETAAAVAALVEGAMAEGLPGHAVANLVLEGVAKGRHGDEVLGAARQLVETLAAARDALRAGGRQPEPSEIQAAGLAMSLGVSGEAVSSLARSAPSGRSLAVPLAVVGVLVTRGIPSDDALEAVRLRLEGMTPDGELAGLSDDLGRLLATGGGARDLALELAAARAGFALPVGGPGSSFGPPGGIPVNGGVPVGRPGLPLRPPRPQPPAGRRP